MLLIDKDIRHLSLNNGMITPFSEAVSGDGVISYGLTHSGYDVRLDREIKIYAGWLGTEVDIKKFGTKGYESLVLDAFTVEDDSFVLPPHYYALGKSYEYFVMPDHISAECVGKSTWARAALITPVTPLEPGWTGFITLELFNANPCPLRVYVMNGICQIRFMQLTGVPEKTYRGKKYDGQVGVVPPRVL